MSRERDETQRRQRREREERQQQREREEREMRMQMQRQRQQTQMHLLQQQQQTPPLPPTADTAAADAGGGSGRGKELVAWVCGVCTFENPAAADACEMCGGEKRQREVYRDNSDSNYSGSGSRGHKKKKKNKKKAEGGASSSSDASGGGSSSGEWACGACTFVNAAMALQCGMCAAVKPSGGGNGNGDYSGLASDSSSSNDKGKEKQLHQHQQHKQHPQRQNQLMHQKQQPWHAAAERDRQIRDSQRREEKARGESFYTQGRRVGQQEGQRRFEAEREQRQREYERDVAAAGAGTGKGGGSGSGKNGGSGAGAGSGKSSGKGKGQGQSKGFDDAVKPFTGKGSGGQVPDFTYSGTGISTCSDMNHMHFASGSGSGGSTIRAAYARDGVRPVIVWFRQDLRLCDNPALVAASTSGRPVIPLYIHAPDDEEGGWPMGGAAKMWMHYSLQVHLHVANTMYVQFCCISLSLPLTRFIGSAFLFLSLHIHSHWTLLCARVTEAG